MQRFTEGRPPAFAARRIRIRFVQRFRASPADVFPLLLPVRESRAGDASLPDTLSVRPTAGAPSCVLPIPSDDAPREDVWVVRRYQPGRCIELVRVNRRRTLCWSVSLLAVRDGACRAVNELLLMGRSEPGNAALPEVAAHHAFEMGLDEVLINHHLAGGRRLPLDGTPVDAAAQAARQALDGLAARPRSSAPASPRRYVPPRNRRFGTRATTRPHPLAASARATSEREPP